MTTDKYGIVTREIVFRQKCKFCGFELRSINNGLGKFQLARHEKNCEAKLKKNAEQFKKENLKAPDVPSVPEGVQ
jgi:hypothetical protein